MTSSQVEWDGLTAHVALVRPVALGGDEEPLLRQALLAVHGIEDVVIHHDRISLRVATSQHRASAEVAMVTLCEMGYLQPIRWQQAE